MECTLTFLKNFKISAISIAQNLQSLSIYQYQANQLMPLLFNNGKKRVVLQRVVLLKNLVEILTSDIKVEFLNTEDILHCNLWNKVKTFIPKLLKMCTPANDLPSYSLSGDICFVCKIFHKECADLEQQ